MSTNEQAIEVCNLPALRRHQAHEEALKAVKAKLGRELFGDEVSAVSAAVSATLEVLERNTERVMLCPECYRMLDCTDGRHAICAEHGSVTVTQYFPGAVKTNAKLAVIFEPLGG